MSEPGDGDTRFIEAMNRRFDELNAKVEQRRPEFDELNARIEQINSRFDELSAQIERSRSELDNLSIDMKIVKERERSRTGVGEYRSPVQPETEPRSDSHSGRTWERKPATSRLS